MQTCPHRSLVARPVQLTSQTQRVTTSSAAHKSSAKPSLRAKRPEAAGVEEASVELGQRLENGSEDQASDLATAVDAIALESEVSSQSLSFLVEAWTCHSHCCKQAELDPCSPESEGSFCCLLPVRLTGQVWQGLPIEAGIFCDRLGRITAACRAA